MDSALTAGAAILVALITLASVIIGGLIGLRKVQQIHLLVNSNLKSAKFDLRVMVWVTLAIVLSFVAAMVKGQIDGAKREQRREEHPSESRTK